MKLSVCMITYNHEKYIRQAVESVLMQKTDFDFEIVIGDDCSTDLTRQVLDELEREHPGRLTIPRRERNLGMIPNFVATLEECRGEYIAILEGDDYWTDPRKLQKQVDFLDAHPESSLCHHAVMYVYEDGSREPLRFPRNTKPFAQLDDLLRGENFVQTCSMVFRRCSAIPLPEWFLQLDLGDWPLCCLVAQSGNLAFIDEVMAVYRVHATNAWYHRDSRKKSESVIRMYEALKSHVDPRFRGTIAGTLAAYYLHLASAASASNDASDAIRCVERAVMRLCEAAEVGEPAQRTITSALLRPYRELEAIKQSVTWRVATRFHQMLDRVPGWSTVVRNIRHRLRLLYKKAVCHG